MELGLRTYIGVPIRRRGGELVGTLCGASRTEHEVTRDAQTLIAIFAHVMGPQLHSLPGPRLAEPV